MTKLKALVLAGLVALVTASATYATTTNVLRAKRGDVVTIGSSNILCSVNTLALYCTLERSGIAGNHRRGDLWVYMSNNRVSVFRYTSSGDSVAVFNRRFG